MQNIDSVVLTSFSTGWCSLTYVLISLTIGLSSILVNVSVLQTGPFPAEEAVVCNHQDIVKQAQSNAFTSATTETW